MSGARTRVLVKAVSDVSCPWCWIGKRHLDNAVANLLPHVDVTVEWHPYMIDTDLPSEGADLLEWRGRGNHCKGGAVHRFRWSEILNGRARGPHIHAGFKVGCIFNWKDGMRMPSTLNAHRVLEEAFDRGGWQLQHELVERIFRAYFTECIDIGKPKELQKVVTAVDPSWDNVKDILDGTDLWLPQVTAAIEENLSVVEEVPHYSFKQVGQKGPAPVALTGALKAEDFARAVQRCIELGEGFHQQWRQEALEGEKENAADGGQQQAPPQRHVVDGEAAN